MSKISLFLSSAAVLLASGCIEHYDNYIDVRHTIAFETVEQNITAGPTAYGENLMEGYFADGSGYERIREYTDSQTGLVFPINTVGGVCDFSNGGCAVSSWCDKEDASIGNRCSVFFKDAVTLCGGVNGSKRFLLVYGPEPVRIHFAGAGESMIFTGLSIANTTYARGAMLEGTDSCRKLDKEHEDWFSVTFTGYNTLSEKTGSVEYFLADFRDNTQVRQGWDEVALKSLGEIAALEISFNGSDRTATALNTPPYCCIDNITLYKRIQTL